MSLSSVTCYNHFMSVIPHLILSLTHECQTVSSWCVKKSLNMSVLCWHPSQVWELMPATELSKVLIAYNSDFSPFSKYLGMARSVFKTDSANRFVLKFRFGWTLLQLRGTPASAA